MKWQINKTDIVLLAAYLGGDLIIGVDDPYLGWLAEQVEEQWPRTMQSLIQLGVAYFDETNILKIDAELDEAIDTCCHPKRFISIGIYGDIKKKITINIGKSKFVVVDEIEDKVSLELQEYSDDSLLMLLSDLLNLPSAAARFLERTITTDNTVVSPAQIEAVERSNADNMISDMFSDPNMKALIVLGDYGQSGSGIRTFGIYVKTGRILRLDESNNGSLNMRSVTANDVLTEIMKE